MPSSGLAGLADEQPAGPAADGGPGRDPRRDADAAAGEAGGDALVVAAAGRPSGGRARRRSLRTWRQYGVQPWRAETFKFSTDPELDAKVTDVVGLVSDPPENAIVLCVDELGRDEAR